MRNAGSQLRHWTLPLFPLRVFYSELLTRQYVLVRELYPKRKPSKRAGAGVNTIFHSRVRAASEIVSLGNHKTGGMSRRDHIRRGKRLFYLVIFASTFPESESTKMISLILPNTISSLARTSYGASKEGRLLLS